MELMEQITDEADPFSDDLASPPSASLVHCAWPNTLLFFCVVGNVSFGFFFVSQTVWETALVAKRPPNGPTRLSVLRRYNRRSRVAVACGLQAHEHLVAVVVQCGIVRAGQTLHVPFSTTTFTSDAAAAPTFTVVGIQIHQRPVYALSVVCGWVGGCRAACVVYHMKIVKEGTRLTPTATGASQHEGGGRRDCGSATGAVTAGCCWV
jgi:hypothetical protein